MNNRHLCKLKNNNNSCFFFFKMIFKNKKNLFNNSCQLACLLIRINYMYNNNCCCSKCLFNSKSYFKWYLLLKILIIDRIQILINSLGTSKDLSWNVSGKTIYDKKMHLNQSNLELGLVSAIGFDENLNFYIVDKTKHRVYRLSDNILKNYIGRNNGSSGSDIQSLNSPNDLFIKSTNEIYIVDTLNHRILLWNSDTNTAEQIFGTGFYFFTIILN